MQTACVQLQNDTLYFVWHYDLRLVAAIVIAFSILCAGDAERLGQQLSLREPCLRNFRAAAMLLKAGVAAGLTLHDIANIVVRTDLDQKSTLERCAAAAVNSRQCLHVSLVPVDT